MMRIFLNLFILFICSTQLYGQQTVIIEKTLIDLDSALISKSYAKKLTPLFEGKRLNGVQTSEEQLRLYIQAYAFWSAGRYNESLELIHKWLPLIPKNNWVLRARLHYLEGENYFDNYQDNKAIQALIKADLLSEKTKKTDLIIAIKQYRANVYLTLGNFVLAKKVIENSWHYYKLCTNVNQKSSYLMVYVSLLNQMAIAEKDGRYSEKAIYHISTLKLEKIDDLKPELQGHLLSELGLSYSILGNHTKALENYKKAEVIFKDRFEKQFKNLQITIFHEYYNTKDYLGLIQRGEDMLKWIPTEQALLARKKEIHQRLAEAYERTGNLPKALYHTHELLKEVEKHAAQKYATDITDIEEKYQSAKKQEKIEQAEVEKRKLLIEKKEKNQEVFYLIFVLFIIVVLLTVAILTSIRFNFIKKKLAIQSEQLAVNNQLLQTEIHHKNFLFRELHHRVKNNFQLVISFLQLQQNTNGNEVSEAFLRNAELKMIAMSMVHEMLYQEENKESIKIRDYLSKLADSIVESMPELNVEVEINVNGANCSIDLDKAISIGLIMNELVTNSIKHAGVEELEIMLIIEELEENLLLRFTDNGAGLPAFFNPSNSNTLGTRVITMLSRQLKAKTTWRNENGAVWLFTLPK